MESDNTSPFGPSRPEGGPWGSTSTPTLPPAPPTVDGQSPLWGAGPASAEPTAPPPSWSTTPAAPPPSLPPAPPVVSGVLPSRSTAGGAGRSFKAALVAFAVFASGAAGVAVGANLSDGTGGSQPAALATGDRGSQIPTSGTVAAGAEPVAAVAQVLSPAVVQIETESGLGSGFVYDESGLILTAAHVIEGSRSVTVRFADGTRLSGTVVGTDSSTDVGVVRIEPVEGMVVATLALDEDLKVGQVAVAIGSPFGLHQTVTAGIVSAVGRSTETQGRDGRTRAIPAIQTDAPINSGNSGGALADRQGRVIGVNSSIITADSNSSGNVGVGFAIPIDIAKAVADRLVEGRSPQSGYLGVSSSDATGSTAGAQIDEVEPGSPASDAGLSVGDVVVAFDGRSIGSAIDLVAAVTTRAPGDEIDITVDRDGRRTEVNVVLAQATN